MNNRNNDLLDEETHPIWGRYLRSNEQILWEGSPQMDMSIRFLEGDAYHDVMTGASSNFILYIFFLFVVARMVYGETGLVSALPFLFFGGGLILIFELLRNRSNKKIRYAVTNHFLLLKYDYFVFKKIAAIPLTKVISIAPIKYEDGTTTMLFPNHNEKRIKTIDFVTGKRRDHTSFEHIADGEEVLKLITSLIKDNNLTPLQYHYPMMRESVVRVTRKIYQFLLFAFVLYMVDFYLLPKRTTTDFVIETVIKTPQGFNTGATHYTQKGFRFSTDYVYSFYGDESEVTFDYSPVFKAITSLKTYRMDYTNRLDSDLNALGKYAALVCFITFLSGVFILNKRPLSRESYTQLVVCTVFFLILFWAVNNWL